MTVGEWLEREGRQIRSGVKPVAYFMAAVIICVIAIGVLCFACQSYPVTSCTVALVVGILGLCRLCGDRDDSEYRRR